MNLKDRYRGCLIGLATCDALGAQIEGGTLGGITPTEMVGGGFYDVQPGGWTDDTAMALCLAESLISIKGSSPRDQLERYKLWRTKGYLSWAKWPLGIGATVRESIDDFITTGNTKRIQDPNKHAGNGSIMRLAPVPMAFRNNKNLLRACETSSYTTHNVPEAIDACVLLGVMIKIALDGGNKNAILFEIPEFSKKLSTRIDNLRTGSWKSKNPSMLQTTGYVVTTLEAAMWVFAKTNTFEDGAKYILNLGGDADTIGAVYGQIAGAFYGLNQIPERWYEKLKMLDTIIKFSDDLLELSEKK